MVAEVSLAGEVLFDCNGLHFQRERSVNVPRQPRVRTPPVLMMVLMSLAQRNYPNRGITKEVVHVVLCLSEMRKQDVFNN